MVGNALSNLAEKILSWLGEAGEAGLSRSQMNIKNGGRNEGIAEALTELRGRGFADYRMIPTGGKAQARWWITTCLPPDTIDDNDDNDDESLGRLEPPLSSTSSPSSIGYINNEDSGDGTNATGL